MGGMFFPPSGVPRNRGGKSSLIAKNNDGLVSAQDFRQNSDKTLMGDQPVSFEKWHGLSEEQLFEILKRVSHAFYERVYKDEWLKEVFKDVKQDFITDQQADFMLGAFGGAQRFSGREPKEAHPHIYVDEEMWQLRERLLTEALEEEKAPEWIRAKWLKIDNAFKRVIFKNSPEECKPRYPNEPIINVPSPYKKAA
jgi:truncated hemoglobin YjbI